MTPVRKWGVGSVVVLLVVIGVFLRFWMLGFAPFRADTMNLYRAALGGQRIVDIWRDPPWLNQIPLGETLSMLAYRSGLPVNPSFAVRAPFALMGSATLLLLWRFAVRRFGTRAGWVVLFLAILNPYQLYYSRTSYYYIGVVFASTAMIMVLWDIRERLRRGELPYRWQWGAWFAATALACHMHMSAWILAAFQGGALFLFGWNGLKHSLNLRKRFLLHVFTIGFLLALLMSRWVYRAILEMIKVSNSGGHLASPIWPELRRLFPAYFAGENLLAVWLLVAVTVVALMALIVSFRRRTEFADFAIIGGLQVLVLMLYVGLAGGGLAKVTYFSGIWPLFIWFLGVGLWQGAEVLSAGRRWVQYGVVGVVLVAYTVLALPPAWAIVNLEGKLIPTLKINEWAIENLPTGTPILVDNWLQPWNQLAIHNADQINYTFTVPDDPIENYRALNWRATAAAFFKKYPQAALLEVDPGKYQDKVGPWHFPEQNFARIVSITNTPAVTLQKYCVYPLGRFALKDGKTRYRNRIFYNTTEDLIAAAKRDNESALRLYGDGWRFLKPWQPMQGWPEQLMQMLWLQAGMVGDGGKTVASLADLQKIPQQQAMRYLNQGRWADYRIPGARSALRLFNLTENELSATLTVTGIALSGNVRCMIGGEVVLFPQTLMVARQVPITLKPGENEVVVAMPMNQFLLVHDVRLTASGAGEIARE